MNGIARGITRDFTRDVTRDNGLRPHVLMACRHDLDDHDLLCIIPLLTDDPRRGYMGVTIAMMTMGHRRRRRPCWSCRPCRCRPCHRRRRLCWSRRSCCSPCHSRRRLQQAPQQAPHRSEPPPSEHQSLSALLGLWPVIPFSLVAVVAVQWQREVVDQVHHPNVMNDDGGQHRPRHGRPGPRARTCSSRSCSREL